MQHEIKLTVLAKSAIAELPDSHPFNGLYIFFDDDKYHWQQESVYIHPADIGTYKPLLQNGICFLYGKQDHFPADYIAAVVNNAFQAKTGTAALLIKYQPPHDTHLRNDGFIYSGILPGAFVKAKHFKEYKDDFAEAIYYIVRDYTESNSSHNLEVLQYGHPHPQVAKPVPPEITRQSGIIIPHIGSLRHLRRCLHNLQHCRSLPNKIRVCFDDASYRKAATAIPAQLGQVSIFRNEPLRCGPYLSRHYTIVNNPEEFQFFCDSDDVSLQNRFSILQHELLENDLDLIGSHELRMDEFQHKIEIHRFPLKVNHAINSGYFHPLLHPTSMIRRSAFIKTGGFSTDLKFGYDTQFILRAHLHLKIANSDNFLYMRFKRPNSLTTNTKTQLGNHVRSIQLWRWSNDYSLIKKGELDLEYSSLAVRKHPFRYRLVAE